MSNAEEKKERNEEKKINQPSLGFHRRPSFGEGKPDLEHPSKVLWKWMLSYLKSLKWKFVLYTILLLLGTIILTISPLVSATLIDNGIIARDPYYVIIMSVVFLSLLVFMAITTYISQYGMGKISQEVTYEVRNDLFFKLQDMSLNYFDQRPSGDIISITTNDVTQLNLLVGGQFVHIITNIVSISITILIMFLLNVYLALISLIIIPIFFVLAFFIQKIIIGVFKKARETIGQVTTSIQENIAGAKIVKAYGQEKRASSEFDQANTANYKIMVKIRGIMATIFPLFTLIVTVLTVIILLLGGFIAIGEINVFGITVSIGVLVAFISLLSQFFRPFMMLLQMQQIIGSALAASDRILSVLEESVEIPEPISAENFSEPKGSIEFINVSFGYILDNNKGKQSPEITSGSQAPDARKLMLQNPMIKKAIEMMKTFPEPYSSFMLKNSMDMPQNVRQKLFMSLMGVKPEEVPKIIDKILDEYHYAVPNTDLAEKHPEYDTSFKNKDGDLKKGMPSKDQLSMGQMIPPKMIEMMVKNLEKMLRSKSGFKQATSGGMGGDSQGLMGVGAMQMSPQAILETLASISIPPEISNKIPKVVKDAIEEKKILIKRQQSKGYVLKDLNLKVPPGATLAIAGETGAGKTTLVKLLARFYDVNIGKIQVDGIDIREVNKKDLRGLIGFVPQDAYLFTGTIKENLLYGIDNPTPEIENKMFEVSKFLGLHNFVETLNKKYDKRIKENGSNISIGQRQLIAFARALITDPKILILDEATSSVDPYTETLIQDALNKARKGRTTIIIAHRLSTIKNADQIIVLGSDKHGIVEQGDHESLLALNGKYKRLLEMQRRDIEINNQ